MPYDRPGTYFSDAKSIGEIPTRSLPMEAPYRGGVRSNGDFPPISRYISEKVQDMDIVS